MKDDIIYYIVGGAVFAGAIGYTMYSSSDDTSSVKEPRSANSNVSDYRKGIINDYWSSKYPDTQAGGSKRKRKNKNKTKKQKH
jgi:hypothetical protein